MGVAEFFTVSEGATRRVWGVCFTPTAGYTANLAEFPHSTPKGEGHTDARRRATNSSVCAPQVRGTPMHFRIARTGQPSAFRMARTRHGCTPRCQWCVWTWAHVLPLGRGGFGTVTVNVGGEGCRLYPFTLLVQRRCGCSNDVSDCPLPIRDGVRRIVATVSHYGIASPTQSGCTRALASGVMLAPLSGNCHHSPSLRSAQMWRSAALRALASSA